MMTTLLSRFHGALLGSTIGLPATLPLQDYHRARVAQLVSTETAGSIPDATSASAVLVEMPLILLYHDTPRELLTRLETRDIDQFSADVSLDAMQIWSQALASCLRGDFSTATLTQLASLLDTSPVSWAALLAELKAAIEDECSLTALRHSVCGRYPPLDSAIAVALYCHASMPAMQQLSCARAARSMLPFAVPLTAALAGASYGVVRLPTDRVTQATFSTSQLLAEKLARTWAGQYRVSATQPLLAIAAAGQLQARLPFQMISQVQSE